MVQHVFLTLHGVLFNRATKAVMLAVFVLLLSQPSSALDLSQRQSAGPLRLRGGMSGADGAPAIMVPILLASGVQMMAFPRAAFDLYKVPLEPSAEALQFTQSQGLNILCTATLIHFFGKGDERTAAIVSYVMYSVNFMNMPSTALGQKMGTTPLLPWMAILFGFTLGALTGHETLVMKLGCYLFGTMSLMQYFFPTEFLKAHKMDVSNDVVGATMFKIGALSNICVHLAVFLYQNYDYETSMIGLFGICVCVCVCLQFMAVVCACVCVRCSSFSLLPMSACVPVMLV